MVTRDTPEDEELREALFGTHPRSEGLPHLMVLAGLALPLAAFWCGLLVGTVCSLAGKARS